MGLGGFPEDSQAGCFSGDGSLISKSGDLWMRNPGSWAECYQESIYGGGHGSPIQVYQGRPWMAGSRERTLNTLPSLKSSQSAIALKSFALKKLSGRGAWVAQLVKRLPLV